MDSTAQTVVGTQKSSTNCCHVWRMDSTVQTAPSDSENINKLLSRLTHGFDSQKSTYAHRYHQRIPITGDGWIRQPKQPLRTEKSSTNCCQGWHKDSTAQKVVGTQKSSTNCCHGWHMDSTAQTVVGTQKSTTNCCHGWRMDSTAQTAHRDSEIIKELLSHVTHGFDSQHVA